MRSLLSLVCALCAVLIATGTHAQTAQARASAGMDLDARFAQAQADPQLAQSLLARGRKVAAVCAHCHGDGGNSTKPSIPNLAGQNPAYLLEQLRQFSDGRRRNMFMEGMIRALEGDEKIGMVLFYASQAVKPQPVVNEPLNARGRDYFRKACFQCHGDDGRGNREIARIAGQQPEYLHTTLTRYRDGRGPRPDSVMSASTRQMSNADIEAVVTYVSSMR